MNCIALSKYKLLYGMEFFFNIIYPVYIKNVKLFTDMFSLCGRLNNVGIE